LIERFMRKAAWTIFNLLFLASGLKSPLQAQSPIGRESPLSSQAAGIYRPHIVFYPDGRFLASFDTNDDSGSRIWARRFSSLGQPLGSEILIRQGTNAGNNSLVVAQARPLVRQDGGFWVLWYELHPDLCRTPTAGLGGANFFRSYSVDGISITAPSRLGEDCEFRIQQALAINDDRLLTLGDKSQGSLSEPFFVAVGEYDAKTGKSLGIFAVDQPRLSVNSLALFLESPQSLFAAWQTATGDSSTSAVWGRRFTPEGNPLDPPIVFNRRGQPGWTNPEVARDGEGNFIAVWEAQEKDGPYEDIYAQRVSASGERVGRIFVVNTIRTSAQRYPTVSADRFGNFVVVWQSYDPALGQFLGWHLRGQLFHKDGRRVGKEFVIPNPGGDNDTWNPKVIFGPNGTFLLHYVATGPVMIRRYAASPGDEACVWRGNTVQCDTGRTGGEAELPLALQLGPGDVPLFGDVDGDGRADPCVRRGGKFLCDTGHEGTLNWQVSFGQGGRAETPLMGDVDGDGRAEACLWDGKELRCDTAHNGGRAEWTVKLGQPGDIPLLGDVDGDGRADPCVFRAGQFLCDTAHDGSAAWKVTFGEPGDLPVLGDFDGDGRADPCVFRAGELLCDTAHDGGTHPAHLVFGRPGDRPLLGNLDGL
jgi:hypothetical protein